MVFRRFMGSVYYEKFMNFKVLLHQNKLILDFIDPNTFAMPSFVL